jgi:hypothetical protein
VLEFILYEDPPRPLMVYIDGLTSQKALTIVKLEWVVDNSQKTLEEVYEGYFSPTVEDEKVSSRVYLCQQ